MAMIHAFKLGVIGILFVSGIALAQTTISQWTLESKEIITEAYTAGEANTTFGIFCSANQCMFYLHQPIACLPKQRYPALIRNPIQTHAITMKCTLVGNKLFLILEPFNTILQATQIGEQIHFAFGLQSPEFMTVRFSLSGARQAIQEALQISAKKGVPKPPATPQPNPPKVIPPARQNPRESTT